MDFSLNLRRLSSILLLFVFLLIFSSCSNNKEAELNQELVEILTKEYENNNISEVQLSNTISRIETYKEAGFFGKYWRPSVATIIVLLVYFVSLTVYFNSKDYFGFERIQTKPIKGKKVFYTWLFLWPIGTNYWITSVDNSARNAFDRLLIFWNIITFFILLYIAWFCYPIWYFLYDSPLTIMKLAFVFSWGGKRLIFIGLIGFLLIFLINFLIGGLSIPYLTYSYNARMLRIHPQITSIMKSDRVGAEEKKNKTVGEFKNIYEKLNKAEEIVNENLVYIDNSEEGRLGKTIKDVFTLGKYSKMKRLESRLDILSDSWDDIRTYQEDMAFNSFLIELELEQEEDKAIRNIYLAKELLSKSTIRTVKSKENQLITRTTKSTLPLNENLTTINVEKGLSDSNIKFNSQVVVSEIMDSLDNTTKHLNSIISENRSIDKDDIISASVEVAVTSAITIIRELMTYNTAVKKQILELERSANQLEKGILSSKKGFVMTETIMLRNLEILEALQKADLVFTRAYEPLRVKAYGVKPSWKKFRNGEKIEPELINSPDYQKDLQFLLNTAREYNRIKHINA